LYKRDERRKRRKTKETPDKRDVRQKRRKTKETKDKRDERQKRRRKIKETKKDKRDERQKRRKTKETKDKRDKRQKRQKIKTTLLSSLFSLLSSHFSRLASLSSLFSLLSSLFSLLSEEGRREKKRKEGGRGREEEKEGGRKIFFPVPPQNQTLIVAFLHGRPSLNVGQAFGLVKSPTRARRRGKEKNHTCALKGDNTTGHHFSRCFSPSRVHHWRR
jgi:hypothetical protein